jgi:probable phosphoglycerate mutase
MKIFCVRHGETNWNRLGYFQGQTDIPLSDKGIEQAEAAGRAMASLTIDRIWSSDLSRARQTAERIACHHGLSVEEEPLITEIDHGEWEGRNVSQIEESWPGMLKRWHDEPHTVTMPEGEDLEHVRERAVRGFASITDKGGENIVLVSHDALLKVLLCSWLDCPLSSFWKFQLGNCSITVVEKLRSSIRIPLMGYVSSPADPFSRVEQKGL